MQPLAIVIPYYRLAFFEATLESLANQTNQRFRVYIGDDASPENPLPLLEKYHQKIDFSYHRFEENLGRQSLVKQWERCLSLVEESFWVMILGDDDLLGDYCVDEFYKHQSEFKTLNVVRFASYIIDSKGEKQSDLFTHPKLEKSTHFLIRKFSGETRSSLGEYVFNKVTLQANGFRDFPLAWHSDEMAVLECSGFDKVYSINSAAVFIRESELSVSGKSDNLAAKHLATYLFCSEMIAKYSKKFTVAGRKKILRRIEKHYFRKPKMALFFKLCFWYLTRTGLINFLKFVRRFFRHSIKR